MKNNNFRYILHNDKPSHRRERVEKDLHKAISNIFIKNKVRSRALYDKDLVVLNVDLSKDLSYAKVYLFSSSVLNSDISNVMQGLDEDTVYIRQQVAKVLKLRRVMQLKFCYSNSIKNYSEITRLLNIS